MRHAIRGTPWICVNCGCFRTMPWTALLGKPAPDGSSHRFGCLQYRCEVAILRALEAAGRTVLYMPSGRAAHPRRTMMSDEVITERYPEAQAAVTRRLPEITDAARLCHNMLDTCLSSGWHEHGVASSTTRDTVVEGTASR